MKKNHTLLICFLFFASATFAQLTVTNLLTENRVNPIGIDVTTPRFSSNTTATVFIPASNADAITESGKSLSAQNIKAGETKDGYVAIEIGSGKYHFVVSSK